MVSIPLCKTKIPKFLKISLYYIEIFNILIISPQKWNLAPQIFELVQ